MPPLRQLAAEAQALAYGCLSVGAATVPRPLSTRRGARHARLSHVTLLVLVLVNETSALQAISADAHERATKGHVAHAANGLDRPRVRRTRQEPTSEQLASGQISSRRLEPEGAIRGTIKHHQHRRAGTHAQRVVVADLRYRNRGEYSQQTATTCRTSCEVVAACRSREYSARFPTAQVAKPSRTSRAHQNAANIPERHPHRLRS